MIRLPLLEAGHGIQLVGLNVPFGLVNTVANTGLDGLPANVRAQLPQIDRSQARLGVVLGLVATALPLPLLLLPLLLLLLLLLHRVRVLVLAHRV